MKNMIIISLLTGAALYSCKRDCTDEEINKRMRYPLTPVQVTAVTDSVYSRGGEEVMAVTVCIKNTGLTTLTYLTRSCSYDESFMADSKNMEILHDICFWNGIQVHELYSMETTPYRLLIRHSTQNHDPFAIDFILVAIKGTESPENYDKLLENKDHRIQSNLIDPAGNYPQMKNHPQPFYQLAY